MRFSLQTREIIADSIETVTCAQHHDANISIPGCDKNMPGVLMAAARHNRKSTEQQNVLTFYCASITSPIATTFSSCCSYTKSY
jgi:hypothetical protein